MPTATEGLRHRHRLMSVKWLMVKTQFPSQKKLKDITKDTLTAHILGEKVRPDLQGRLRDGGGRIQLAAVSRVRVADPQAHA